MNKIHKQESQTKIKITNTTRNCSANENHKIMKKVRTKRQTSNMNNNHKLQVEIITQLKL